MNPIGSQHSATSHYEPTSRRSLESESLLGDRPDIDEELRKLAKEQEQFNSRRSSAQTNPLRPKPLNTLSRHTSPDPQAATTADAQWGDPYATTPFTSPPISSASFKSKGSARSKGSHRAPRKASTPARFEPDREGRPLDSPMTAAIPTSPTRSASPFPLAPSVTSHTDRSFSIAPSLALAQDDQRSLSFVPSIVPLPDDQRSLSIVPSIAPTPENDLPSVQQTPVLETHGFDPSVLDFNPSDHLDRNASIASNQTIPRSLFRDFDGVHVSPLVDEEIAEEEEEEEEGAKEVHTEGLGFEGIDSVHPDSVYDMWFQQQWQQAENDVHEKSGPAVEERSQDGAIVDDVKQSSPQPWAEPPPGEDMQYYPAPVPRRLNMPQRLSRQLPPETMAKRRSQVLGSVDLEARKSAIWLGDDGAQQNAEQGVSTKAVSHRRQRSSLANMKNLPPQLRASIFFEHEAVPHQIEMKGQSATATLEHMLDESVQGPITSDMDARHPDAIGKHKARSSTASVFVDGKRTSRLSMMSAPLSEKRSDDRLSRISKLSGNRSASFDNLTQAGNRSSSALSLSRFSFEGKRNSSALDIDHPALRIVNGSDIGEGDHLHDAEVGDGQPAESAHERDEGTHPEGELAGEEGFQADEEDEEAKKDEDEYDEAVHGPPTTLLAELQLRKQKLRQRNRTAVSAFPNGMHSTLLEMDAVAQIEKRRRHGKPTTLAWEDPSAKGTVPQVDDDDVPLGVLFPSQNGLIAKGKNDHWDQPLGLLQQREREENEPLSKRRNRLMGVTPEQASQMQREQELRGQESASPNLYDGQQQGVGHQEPDHEDPDHEGETMAQRIRRLRSQRALDDAIGGTREGAHSRGLSDDFASEMMSSFGPLHGETKEESDTRKEHGDEPNEADREGETLGQRRKRLQAEAAARQVSGGSVEPPVLKPSPSMANILSQVPQSALGLRQVSDESRSPGLISENQAKQAMHKQHILDQNTKSGNGTGIDEPLVNVTHDNQDTKVQGNRGGAGIRQSFMPGQWSGLRSKSSLDLLRDQAGTPQPLSQPQPQQNPWTGFGPQSFAHGLGAVGSNFNAQERSSSPFPHFPGNSAGPNFANDPKGGVSHHANHGSMLWQQERSKRTSVLPRQWTDGNFGFTGLGMGRTYAANAMVQKQPSFEQVDAAPMSAGQRAKIEQWRTSIMH